MGKMKPVEVRSQLVEALRLDLVGPDNGSDLEAEVLTQAPSRWYLAGFLVPLEADPAQKSDDTSQDEFDFEGGDSDAADDDTIPETPAARRAFFPSSIGLSLLVAETTRQLKVIVQWGDYRPEAPRTGEHAGEKPAPDAMPRSLLHWHRSPRRATVDVDLPAETALAKEDKIPGSQGLCLAVSVRSVQALGIAKELVPAGSRSVSVFLVNRRTPLDADEVRDSRFIFQASLEVQSPELLVARPDIRGLAAEQGYASSIDPDQRVADLQYRDVCEYAVGHGIATQAEVDEQGDCRRVRTCWIPAAEVERIAPATIPDVELRMETLTQLVDASAAKKALGSFATRYREWIEEQAGVLASLSPRRREVAEALLHGGRMASKRIDAGIEALAGEKVLIAFRTANRVMARAARRRFGPMKGKDESSVETPTWRPFQLAFILMNLPGIVDPHHHDRGVVDLLFFPTGGGKTEAYLGLAAFILVHRRLKNPGYASAGLSVLMRYTLRLLTLDQLSRAATLICALELERLKDPDTLGPWPFEIGLWVGRAATPNRMGGPGDADPNCAYRKTIAFQNDDRKPAPIPLENCPWCGEKFKPPSFQLVPSAKAPIDLRVVCINRRCDFTRNTSLPILAVDEPIYRRLPCFLIATVDKFAAMPWTGPVGGFFGRASRYDPHGFYGPCEEGRGHPLPAPIPPPDLIIQDELHLISGPMGSVVGLYEAALDELCSRVVEGKKIRPKIIASTATVRRAENQIRALFNRRQVEVFPPPGPDRRDSFFSETHPPSRSHPRLYLGVAAQGRSIKGCDAADLPGPPCCRTGILRRRWRQKEPGERGRRLHDSARLFQQPPRARRCPTDRRGRGQSASHRLCQPQASWPEGGAVREQIDRV
jgi:hypothetical protein